jgi:hypothetical protein
MEEYGRRLLAELWTKKIKLPVFVQGESWAQNPALHTFLNMNTILIQLTLTLVLSLFRLILFQCMAILFDYRGYWSNNYYIVWKERNGHIQGINMEIQVKGMDFSDQK